MAETVILIYGFSLMLPDDYENISQSVIASNFFANNILADITTKNYWDAINEYKPLMHTWYLGILMQFYILFVIVDLAIYKLKGKRISIYIIVWSVISLLSLFLYFLDIPSSHKFYQIPFRIFEFGAGSLSFYLLARNSDKRLNRWNEVLLGISLVAIICLLFVSVNLITATYKLLIVVGLTCIMTYYLPKSQLINNRMWFNRLLAVIGTASFSLFIWHQVVFALTRYSFTSNLYEGIVPIILLSIIFLLTIISYRYIELMRFSKRKITVIIFLFCVINASAFIIFKRAGIFYNIPELDVSVDNVQSGIWAKYCDQGFKYDRDFSDSDKPKWMVIGNSFGRDFVNIIIESDIHDKIDLIYASNIHDERHQKLLKDADLLFISTLGLNKDLVDEVQSKKNSNTRLVIVGEKNFGVNNGQVFRKRGTDDYLRSTIAMEEGYDERNNINLKEYGGDYIDLIALVKTSNGKVRVFSNDGRFISQDCRHLTRAGAQFYANKIDWSQYLKE